MGTDADADPEPEVEQIRGPPAVRQRDHRLMFASSLRLLPVFVWSGRYEPTLGRTADWALTCGL